MKNMSTETGRMDAELERVKSELRKAEKKQSEYLTEIKSHRCTIADLEKLKSVIQANEQIIEDFKAKSQERDGCIQRIKSDLSEAREAQQHLETKIREELEKQRANDYATQEMAKIPRCPKDIEDFKDYLRYNFESLGVPTGAEYYSLLKDYLSVILFQGKPVIISRNAGISVMKCISNALVGTTDVATLDFTPSISEEAVNGYLSQDKRIVCLDNFIGNFNETTLLTICDKHRNKIVFLTVAYDRTLNYLPEEFFKYCHYLNLNRIEAFSRSHEPKEDPSTIEEIEASTSIITPNLRWSQELKKMLSEFGVCDALASYKSSLVSDELSLCCLLAFDTLPYCVDVFRIAPFSISERLVKYAGDSGRCPYKNLFRRWFA